MFDLLGTALKETNCLSPRSFQIFVGFLSNRIGFEKSVARDSKPHNILLTSGISLANYFEKLIYLEVAIYNRNYLFGERFGLEIATYLIHSS